MAFPDLTRRFLSIGAVTALFYPRGLDQLSQNDACRRPLNILFVGNSYTFHNDMPRMVQDIARSDRLGPCTINVEMIAAGGARLDDLWKMPERAGKLTSRRWDAVVLQSYSLSAVSGEERRRAENAFTQWARAIREIGSRGIIYQTWARQPGSAWYRPDNGLTNVRLVSPEDMQQQISGLTAFMAAALNATVAHVGDRWAIARNTQGAPNLYAADGSHPTVAGSYLAALVMFKTITGHSPERVSYRPQGMTEATAGVLQRIAAGD